MGDGTVYGEPPVLPVEDAQAIIEALNRLGTSPRSDGEGE